MTDIARAAGMTVRVGRRYHFTAKHIVEAAAPPWNEIHEHRYTLELIGEGIYDEATGMACPMDMWDAELDQTLRELDGGNLNEVIGGPTTVESLARYFHGVMEWEEADSGVVEVRVYEDDDRWGSSVATVTA